MFLLFVFSVLISGQVRAAGDAGCGLGSIIFKSNSKLLQLSASTTNGTSANQIFAITSGTSNCTSSGFVKNDKELEYYVEVNHEDLLRQMAQGSGEKLQILAQFYGCKSPESQAAFIGMTKTEYSALVPAADISPGNLVSNINGKLSAHSDLSQLCTAKYN